MENQELYLPSPWVNAPGMLGFSPTQRWPVPGIEIKELGAFVTNPISLGPRTPAGERCQIDFPGGALLHSGLPNPGLSRVLRRFGERWAQANVAIWVHVFGTKPGEIYEMVRRLEGREGVAAIELGLADNAAPEQALETVAAAYGELPLIVHLPLDRIHDSWVKELPKMGVSAISLSAPRGMLVSDHGAAVNGRLCGPSLLPLTLAAVQSSRSLGLPVLAGAGVYRRQDAQKILDAGALAVQLDTVLWRGWGE
jgi:dihydroorotate dehydrogenase (NAD+) catalytic subunit